MRKAKIILAALMLLLVVQSSDVFAQKSIPKHGIWQVTGKDEVSGWTALLKLSSKKNRPHSVTYKGYYIWRSSDKETVGTEYVTATFSKRTRKLVLKGYALKIRRGDLVKGIYTANVSKNGARLMRGTWTGVEAADGTWSAKWLRNK